MYIFFADEDRVITHVAGFEVNNISNTQLSNGICLFTSFTSLITCVLLVK